MEILIEMDTVSVIDTIIVIEGNSCCICLEECDIYTSDIEMKCCLNVIHKKCLFDILIYTQNLTLHCPLCRTEYNFKNDNILKLYEILDIYTQYKDTFNFVDHNIRLQNIIDIYTTDVNAEINTSSNKICIFFGIMCLFVIVIILIIFSISKK